jgi:hypothetical protein
MPVCVGHLLLALAAFALGAAAVRAASFAAPRGLVPVVAAAPLGVAAAVVEAPPASCRSTASPPSRRPTSSSSTPATW